MTTGRDNEAGRDDEALLRLYHGQQKNGTLYIGMTNNLTRRVWQHKHDIQEGFTQKYQVHKLVYHESYDDVQAAIRREKQMKKWKRQWKINLIEQENPNWDDLFESF